VVPYKPFNLGFEDSASLLNYTQDTKEAKIKVGVIHLPHISNFNDFEPLVVDREVELSFIKSPLEAKMMDVIILPGSKMVFDDLLWLRKNGFEEILKDKKKLLIAICGGYEMMFENLIDNEGVESSLKQLQGFGRFKGDVVFQKQKITKKGCYNLFGVMVRGFEIHNGITKKRAKKKKNLYGTFVHGLFESDELREFFFKKVNPTYKGYDFKAYKQKAIEEYATFMQKHIDIDKILKEIKS
jgi:adenosylcobyric acid synthase